MKTSTTERALIYMSQAREAFKEHDYDTYAYYLRMTPGEFARIYLQLALTFIPKYDDGDEEDSPACQ